MADEFLIPEDLHQEYERLKKQFLAKGHMLAIEECPAELFKLPDQKLLEAVGVGGCTALQYAKDTYNAAEPGNDRIGGRMIPVEKEGRRFAVIFIRNDYGPDVPAAQEIMYKVCVLYHELGHAEDFYQGINFDHMTMTCRLKNAEAYAHEYAERHLKRIECKKVVKGRERDTTLGAWYHENMPRGVYAA